jgi:hypothetical protein
VADITMCRNHNCPLARMCQRNQATPHPYWQSYAMYMYDLVWDSFDQDHRVECENYWPVKFEKENAK